MRPSKRGVQGIALFLIMLVISTTFYSANALAASVQVTKNSGKAGIESENHLKGWIDTDAGEEWALEVSAEMGAAADASTEVKKENVFLVRGKSEYAFDSCTKGLGNDYVCTRKELLKNPVSEQEYKFTVALKDDTGKKLAESSAASLYADGSAPEASISSITKSGEGEYKAVFSVEEVPVAFCSGIEKVQLLEGENVLKEVSLETGKEECSFTGEEAFTFAFSGTEQKYFKVKAVDRLGHESISSSFPYFIDATKPQVVTETVAFSTGEFVSEKLVSGTVRVNVAEDTKLAKVVLANAELGFTDEEGSCEKIEGTVHTCMWEFADKVMAPEMTLTFTATDSAGNTASATTKKTFSLDVTAPAITFFGSSKVFEEVSYIKKEDNTIVALIEESGSGISKESVRADLSEVGRGEYEMPDECTQQENTPSSGQESGLWRCVWEAVSVSGQSSSYTVRLVSLTDNANNEASGATAELKFDSVLPVVKSLAMAALGEGAAGTEKEFVQAGDLLRLAFSIEEVNGISIAIDAGGFVTDAKTTYPEGILTLNQDDPEAACERDEEKNLWNCVVEFVGVSGTEFKAPLHVSVTDTAGNAAKAYEKVSENMDCKETISTGSFKQCTFDLFGIKAEEAVPDIWEVKSVKQLNEFVDMDTTALAYAVAPMEVRLKTGKENAKARLVTLAGCAPAEEDAAFADAGNHKNQLIYGNAYLEGVEDPKPKIVLQFNTFDAKEFFEEDIEAAKEEKGKFDFALVNYICTLKVFSTVGNLAYEQPETEQFSFLVKFGFSELGTATANLDEQIKVAKEEVESGF